MSEVICDNTFVGIIARDSESRILLIERKKFPTEIPLSTTDFVLPMEPSPSFGWAPPSGHCDGQTYPTACFKEFEEETGLKVKGAPRSVKLASPVKRNKCRRKNGDWHEWMIFEIDWQGELNPSQEETKNIKWCTDDEVRELANKTKNYLWRMKESVKAEEESWTRGIQELIEKEWRDSPGLEPVWYEFFQELKIT